MQVPSETEVRGLIRQEKLAKIQAQKENAKKEKGGGQVALQYMINI